MDMPSFMSKHTVFFFISKKTFIEKKKDYFMQNEAWSSQKNYKQQKFMYLSKKKKKIYVQEKRESINIGMESLEVSPQA